MLLRQTAPPMAEQSGIWRSNRTVGSPLADAVQNPTFSPLSATSRGRIGLVVDSATPLVPHERLRAGCPLLGRRHVLPPVMHRRAVGHAAVPRRVRHARRPPKLVRACASPALTRGPCSPSMA